MSGSRCAGGPASWPALPALASLDLSRNRLPALPANLWQALPRLERLNVSGCQLSGTIPAGLGEEGQGLSLTVIDMSANGLLEGNLPPGLTQLPDLAWADFSGTNISGTLPEGWHQTAALACSACNLTGAPARAPARAPGGRSHQRPLLREGSPLLAGASSVGASRAQAWQSVDAALLPPAPSRSG